MQTLVKPLRPHGPPPDPMGGESPQAHASALWACQLRHSSHCNKRTHEPSPWGQQSVKPVQWLAQHQVACLQLRHRLRLHLSHRTRSTRGRRGGPAPQAEQPRPPSSRGKSHSGGSALSLGTVALQEDRESQLLASSLRLAAGGPSPGYPRVESQACATRRRRGGPGAAGHSCSKIVVSVDAALSRGLCSAPCGA